MKRNKKIFGIPSVHLPDLHIVIISVIFILIFPIAAIVAYKLVDVPQEPDIISTTVKTKEVIESEHVSECNVVE